MSKVFCDKCSRPAGRGKRVGTVCECGGTYQMSEEKIENKQTSDLTVGKVVFSPLPAPPVSMHTSNVIISKEVDSNREAVDVVNKIAYENTKMSLDDLSKKYDRVVLEMQEAKRLLEERGRAIAEAMGRYRGTEPLIEAVKRLATDHFNLVQSNEKLVSEVEKLKGEIDSNITEEPAQPAGPSRRGRGRTANAPPAQTASEPKMRCGPYCSILHQHVR